MPQFNKGNKKATNKKPNWIAKIEGGKAIIIPLTTSGTNKPEWQEPFKTKGSNKLSWLQLYSGKAYPINKWGELNTAYITLESLTEEQNMFLWKQALMWSESNPWWILKDAE